MVEKLMNVASLSRVGCICNLDLKLLLETVERIWVKKKSTPFSMDIISISRNR